MILLSPDAAEDVERLRTFLDQNNPNAARRALASIWTAVDRLQEFPDLGMPTEDDEIRQIVVWFGASGYIVSYSALPGDKDMARPRGSDLIGTHGWKSFPTNFSFASASSSSAPPPDSAPPIWAITTRVAAIASGAPSTKSASRRGDTSRMNFPHY